MSEGTEKKQRLNHNVLLTKILRILLIHNPNDITMSLISRKTGVPRPTLYYYYGKDVEKLLAEAVRFGMQQFIQSDTLTDLSHFSSWSTFQEYRFLKAVSLIHDFPWSIRLYFKYRDDMTSLGETIRQFETIYLNGTRAAYKYFNKRAPEDRYEVLAGALKLGVLWGVSLSIDSDLSSKPLSSHQNAFKKLDKDVDLKKISKLLSQISGVFLDKN